MIYKLIKRFEDIIFSIIIIIFFSPLLIIICIISFFVQGLPIFYISERMVARDKIIKIFKFRTMVKDAKDEKYKLNEKYFNNGYLDIPITDKVYTPLGRFLERTQIVEIPQVFAVLFGKLSFIGNRPLPKSNVEIIKKNFPDKWFKRFDSPCGMTGISQVVGKFKLTPEERLELEALYSEVYLNGNVFKADTYIFFSTIILLIFGDSVAYRGIENAKKIMKSCLKIK